MCTKSLVLVMLLATTSAFAQQSPQKPQEPAKTEQATSTSASAQNVPAGANNASAIDLNLPVPVSLSNSPSKTPDLKTTGATQATSGSQTTAVPAMEVIDAKSMVDMQVSGKRVAKKPVSEFALIRISDVEFKKTALVMFRGIKTPVVTGSELGKYKVRSIEADSVCLVESAKAKKCQKNVTFAEGE